MSETFRVRYGQEELVLEVGKLAKQADGAVMVQYGGTVVLVTACGTKQPKENVDFFPLTVEYQEKTYAAGKIPGGFFKREGRPSEKEILTARLMDRPIRPLFPEGFTHEVQVMGMVLSHDGSHDPDMLAMVGASASLMISNIPFSGPVGSLRVGHVNGQFVVNPTYAERGQADLELILSSTREGIIMVEAGAKQVPEELMLEALEFGASYAQVLVKLQEEMVRKIGKPKMEYTPRRVDPALLEKVTSLAQTELKRLTRIAEKEGREDGVEKLTRSVIEKLVGEDGELTERQIREAVAQLERGEIRKLTLDEKRRIDGRGYLDIRPISCEIGVLPRAHGSGLFTRGQTQSLAVTTLGTTDDEQRIDALEGEWTKTFMLHYNFPPFSVGEVKPVRGPGRREIGHGALAERALQPVMPVKEEFPYTVRVVSDILESNGSSSMASVCAGTLSLMDAGVPVKAPVAGIAMGLVKEGSRFAVLTDLNGAEDHYGDMDFKVAGTQAGITALQLDIKISEGLTLEIFRAALEQARQARHQVLDKITSVIALPKPDISEFAPRIITLKINPDKIREVIGPGGKMIRKIIQETGATIDIEDDGTVQIASSDSAALAKAVDIVKRITEDVEVGKMYTGKIKRIMNFGAFCEVLPGKEGLIHVSELADKFIEKVEDVVKIGDEVQVKVIEIDEQGRINLSMKQQPSSPRKRERERERER